MRKRYHWFVKFLAFALVFAGAGAAALWGLSAIHNFSHDLYRASSLEEKKQERIEGRILGESYETALYLGHEYLLGLRTGTDTREKEAWKEQISTHWGYRHFLLEEADFEIRDPKGTVLSSRKTREGYVMTVPQTVFLNDGIVVSMGSGIANKVFPDFEELTPDYEWKDWTGKPLPGLDSRTVRYDFYNDGTTLYRVERFRDLEITVELKLTQADVDRIAAETQGLGLLEATWQMKEFDLAAAGVSALIVLLCLIFLCAAAGKGPRGEDIIPRGLNRMPLDLALGLWGGGAFGAGALGVLAVELMMQTLQTEEVWLFMGIFGLCGAGIALCAACFLTALFAQGRMGGSYWLRRTLAARILRGLWRLVKKLCRRLWALAATLWGWLWGKARGARITGKAASSIPRFGHMLRGVWGKLHLCWQWLLLYGVLVALIAFASAVFWQYEGAVMLLVSLVGGLIVLYTSYGFARLRDAARRMSRGDLDTKIDTCAEFLYGNFAQFAEDLNALGNTCTEAALEKMKSERMKSELITNVSHDIKTPLTSIINYVDLLEKTESEEERREYLEVLRRQSQRLKKLIEDLMEMSKASSGNIVAELEENDIVEAVNQALGEFADRMEAMNLDVIFRQSHQSIFAAFDGKLLWRVLSNCLSNAVKYALPGTRVYVDVQADEKVRLSIKNISREPLNISAEELAERFVRGDASRNSEGNGLGLNIARSLMEAQGGTLELMVDGDLFKVTLTLGRN